MGMMVVPRTALGGAGVLVAAALTLALALVGGAGGAAAIKIWSYPVKLVEKPPTVKSPAKKKSDPDVVVDHTLPEIIRRRIAEESLLTEDVCEADFYFVPYGISTLIRKAYHHSYKRAANHKMVLEGGIGSLVKDLAVLKLDKGDRHIINVEEMVSKYTFSQQSNYRFRYNTLHGVSFLHTLGSRNPLIRPQDIQVPPFCHDCPTEFPALPLDVEENMLWTLRKRAIAYFGFIEEGFWGKFKFDLIDVCNSTRARMEGTESKGECAVLHKPSSEVTAYELYSNATFCLCPPPLGYKNNHMPSAVAAGCLPVFYPANYITLPWEDVLPYESFSEIVEEDVNLKKPLPDRLKEDKEIGKFHEISDSLLKMPLETIAMRRDNLRQHRSRLFWRLNGTEATGAPQGPDAFDTLIEVLEKRAQEEPQDKKMKRQTACRKMVDESKWKDGSVSLLYYND